jgi:hypothetical protein
MTGRSWWLSDWHMLPLPTQGLPLILLWALLLLESGEGPTAEAAGVSTWRGTFWTCASSDCTGGGTVASWAGTTANGRQTDTCLAKRERFDDVDLVDGDGDADFDVDGGGGGAAGDVMTRRSWRLSDWHMLTLLLWALLLLQSGEGPTAAATGVNTWRGTCWTCASSSETDCTGGGTVASWAGITAIISSTANDRQAGSTRAGGGGTGSDGGSGGGGGGGAGVMTGRSWWLSDWHMLPLPTQGLPLILLWALLLLESVEGPTAEAAGVST